MRGANPMPISAARRLSCDGRHSPAPASRVTLRFAQTTVAKKHKHYGYDLVSTDCNGITAGRRPRTARLVIQSWRSNSAGSRPARSMIDRSRSYEDDDETQSRPAIASDACCASSAPAGESGGALNQAMSPIETIRATPSSTSRRPSIDPFCRARCTVCRAGRDAVRGFIGFPCMHTSLAQKKIPHEADS